jgi:hypothetical protein
MAVSGTACLTIICRARSGVSAISGDLRLEKCTPLADTGRSKQQLPLPIDWLVGDLENAGRVFECQAVRPPEYRNWSNDAGWRPGPNTIGTFQRFMACSERWTSSVPAT